MNAVKSRSKDRLTHFERVIIGRKVNQMIGRSGLNSNDRDSLKQELATRLLERLKFFNRARAHRNAFATMVVERCAAQILRYRHAEKRDHRRISSLNVMVASSDGGLIELGSTIGLDEYDARRCRTTRTQEQQFELTQDIEAVLESLPDDLRKLAEQLKEKPLTQIAREMGIPRSTLRERLYALRRRFETADMRFHL